MGVPPNFAEEEIRKKTAIFGQKTIINIIASVLISTFSNFCGYTYCSVATYLQHIHLAIYMIHDVLFLLMFY